MSALAMIDAPDLKMSSREIAQLCEKRHDNVKRTVKTLADKGVIAFPQIEEKPTDGRPTMEYIFSGDQGKRDSIIVVAQLSPEFTARLVDRWQELENGTLKEPLLPQFQAIQDLILQANEQERRLRAVENEQEAINTRLDRLDSDTGFRTITAHCRIEGLRLSVSQAGVIGRRAASACKRLGVQPGKVPDERFGLVNSYPVQVLEEVLTHA